MEKKEKNSSLEKVDKRKRSKKEVGEIELQAIKLRGAHVGMMHKCVKKTS